MMSRGSFNGPGGPHTRYLVPATLGGSLGSQHNVRNKLKLGFVEPRHVLQLNRDGLAGSGLAVAEVTAREADPRDGLAGVRVTLDGAEGDKSPPCNVASNPLCDGVRLAANGSVTGKYNHYMLESVQQIGSDSFSPGHGVLVSKLKNSEGQSCGTFSCFVWIVDAKPENIGKVDFIRPDGTPAMVTIGDPRQLNDATFNAGLESGTEFEYVDEANRLHFYIVDVRKDADGILHYTTAVRSLDGSGPQTRGVALQRRAGAAGRRRARGRRARSRCATPAPPPRPRRACTRRTRARSSAATSTGCRPRRPVPAGPRKLRNALAAVKFGESVDIPVYVARAARRRVVRPGDADRHLRERPEQDRHRRLRRGRRAGRRHGAGDARVDDGHAGDVRRVPARLRPRLRGVDDRERDLDRGRRDAVRRRSQPGRDRPPGQRRVLAARSRCRPRARSSAYAPVGGSASPTSLETWSGPVSNDPVAIGFKQPIRSGDALRTGTYAKTLTFTLSTTTP